MATRVTWLLVVVALFVSCQKSGEGGGFGEGRQTFRELLALRDQISKEFHETVGDVSLADKRLTVKFVNSPLSSRPAEEKQQRADAVAACVLKNYKQPVSSVAIQFVSDTAEGDIYVGRPPAPERTPQAVVNEHLDALNHCDYDRLMALYPPEAHLFLPGGQVVKGREQVAATYRQAVKPFKDGGVCGLTFAAQTTFPVGDTVNVQWQATADFLAEPYLGADAYVTRGGLMWAQVTTFDRAEIRVR